MLERRDHHDARIVPKDIFRAIAVMHIEIHNGDTFQSVHLDSIGDSCRDIVKQTETHGSPSLRMMTRGANTAKSALHILSHHEIRRQDDSRYGTISSLQAV